MSLGMRPKFTRWECRYQGRRARRPPAARASGHGRVVLKGMADEQHLAGPVGRLGQLDCLGRRLRERLLDEHALARVEGWPAAARGSGRGRRRSGVEPGVAEHPVQVGDHPHLAGSLRALARRGGSGSTQVAERGPARARISGPGSAPSIRTRRPPRLIVRVHSTHPRRTGSPSLPAVEPLQMDNDACYARPARIPDEAGCGRRWRRGDRSGHTRGMAVVLHHIVIDAHDLPAWPGSGRSCWVGGSSPNGNAKS